MSRLSAQSIREFCTSPLLKVVDIKPMIEPFEERGVFDGKSFGLSACSYDIRIREACRLCPGDFMLASTLERFQIPHDICCTVHDKSSWARKGIAVQNTLFDPGWCGYATLELSNHGTDIVHIKAGSPIAQVVFDRLDKPTELPYHGKYLDQPARPVESIDEGA
jgi:dCTP deaminase